MKTTDIQVGKTYTNGVETARRVLEIMPATSSRLQRVRYATGPPGYPTRRMTLTAFAKWAVAEVVDKETPEKANDNHLALLKDLKMSLEEDIRLITDRVQARQVEVDQAILTLDQVQDKLDKVKHDLDKAGLALMLVMDELGKQIA